MEQQEFKFDLFDVVRIGIRWKKYLLVFAFSAALITGLYFVFQPNFYRAYGAFFPSSAVMSGRINLFRAENQDWIDMFGGENEVDRAYVIANSSNVISYLIGKYEIQKHYKIDSTQKNAAQKTYKRFMKNFSVTRSGFKHLEVNFTDEDSKLASDVVNEAMNRVDQQIRELYIHINTQLSLAIDTRKDSISKELAVYTDSLVNLRVKYNMYELVAPSRKNLISSTAHGSGLAYAQGLEEVQNVEEMKDKLAMDRAKYSSLSSEFKTAKFDGFPMIHVTQWAVPFGAKAGPFRTLNVITAFFAAFFVGLLIAIIIDIFSTHKAKMI